MADTLVTPLNDSFVDFDVLGTVDPVTFAVTGTSHFSDMVREARRQRRVVDHATIDWIVVRNRLSMLGSRNKRLVGEGLQELSLRLGFRAVDGFAERVIFREFYPRGLTALDNLDEDTLGTRPSMSHVTARQEVETLLKSLKLPIDERGMRRAAARQEWFAAQAQPLELARPSRTGNGGEANGSPAIVEFAEAGDAPGLFRCANFRFTFQTAGVQKHPSSAAPVLARRGERRAFPSPRITKEVSLTNVRRAGSFLETRGVYILTPCGHAELTMGVRPRGAPLQRFFPWTSGPPSGDGWGRPFTNALDPTKFSPLPSAPPARYRTDP